MLHLYPLDPEATMRIIRQESRAAECRAAAERRARAARRASPDPGGAVAVGRWLIAGWRGRPRRRGRAVA